MSDSVAIIGGGISGLTAAYYLKQWTDCKVSLYEATERVGGWIQTLEEDGLIFEKGPRSLRGRGEIEDTLQLIESLKLEDQILLPQAFATKRYLYDGHSLVSLPEYLFQVPFNPLTFHWPKSLLKDLFAARGGLEDESIASFFKRRLGGPWVRNLIDPMVSGIFAGDCERLSIKSCFPSFHEWEKTHRSLLMGALLSKKKLRTALSQRLLQGASLFSFKNGLSTLPNALKKECEDSVSCNILLTKVVLRSNQVELSFSNGDIRQFDHVIFALSARHLEMLFPLIPGWNALNFASVASLNLAYHQNVHEREGFGYLVPSHVRSSILGCIFDSSVFPEQGFAKNCVTRLTVMMGGAHRSDLLDLEDSELVELALSDLRKQLGISSQPFKIEVSKALQAIPQYELGYERWKAQMMERMAAYSSRLSFLGSSFGTVSIHGCISGAKRLVQEKFV